MIASREKRTKVASIKVMNFVEHKDLSRSGLIFHGYFYNTVCTIALVKAGASKDMLISCWMSTCILE